MKGLPVQVLEHTSQHHHSPLHIFICICILFSAQDHGCGATCPGMAVPNLHKALLGSTFDMWGDTMEGPMPYGVTEAAIMPLWTVLIGMIHPIVVTFPTVIPGDARAYLFLSFLSLSHALYGVGIATITPPRFRSTVVAGTYAVTRATTNLLLLVSMVT